MRKLVLENYLDGFILSYMIKSSIEFPFCIAFCPTVNLSLTLSFSLSLPVSCYLFLSLLTACDSTDGSTKSHTGWHSLSLSHLHTENVFVNIQRLTQEEVVGVAEGGVIGKPFEKDVCFSKKQKGGTNRLLDFVSNIKNWLVMNS